MLALLSSLDPAHLIRTGGYVLLFGIVFAESGLLIGFFLPGDSLLFIAGMASAGTLAASRGPDAIHFNIWVVMVGVFAAAAIGDQVGYAIGRKAGPALFRRPDSRFFKHEHLDRSQEFFDHHGPRAVILARFVPVVRTFCPVTAGASRMRYSTFVRFNLVGAFVWGVGVTLLGYFLGNVALIADHVEIALILLVIISLLPIGIEALRSRRAWAKSSL